MSTLLSKILPISPSKTKKNEDEDEYSFEYSFADEYKGPPLSYNIPRAIPVNIDRIPVASIASNRPIIYPIVKCDPLSNKSIHKKKSGELVTSSDLLVFSDSHDNSRELSEIEDLNDDNEEDLLSDDDISDDNYVSEDEEGPRHVRKPSIVTFLEPETSNNQENISIIPVIKPNLKIGSCYHCFKINRFSEKENCITCNAKYCGNCVIRAMGSMPEGRKCINCIGYAINESRRGALGKPSRVLKRLFTEIEIENIMKREIFCEANHLPSTLVYVNGKALCREEFVLLQNCLYPPRKIEPGRYWYDKTAGFWGKEGKKPSQIISAELAIGGEIKRNSSNGKTNVVINKREITKAERRMLQWAGIRCEGCPSFWLGADGSLQEEGMKNVTAKIWEKSGIHLVCSLLFLPIPPQNADTSKNEVENVANGALSNNFHKEVLYKILLVGSDQSGTSTIYKQARMVHNVRFTDEERENIKIMIQTSLYTYLGILLEGREEFEEEYSGDQPDDEQNCVYYLIPRLRDFSDWFIQVMILGKLEDIFLASSRENAPIILDLLKDQAIQATYNRMNELNMMPRAAKYILDRAVEILRVDYEPSDADILYSDGVKSSNGLASFEFSFPEPTEDSFMENVDPKDTRTRKYQLTRIHSSTLGENCKWLEMFEDTDLVLFTVSITDYDQFSQTKNGVSENKMLQNKIFFEKIATHPCFHRKNFLLVLNNFNLLTEKIEKSPLSKCEWFYDFDPVISRHPRSETSVYSNPSLAQVAFHYIAVKFKGLFRSFNGRNLYVSMVNGSEKKSVDEMIKYAKEILIWEEEKPSFIAHDTSSSTIEPSSSA